MNWNLSNVVISKGDINGNIRPNKNESADSIDGVIALLNAIAGYLKYHGNNINEYLDADKR